MGGGEGGNIRVINFFLVEEEFNFLEFVEEDLLRLWVAISLL